MGDGWQGLKRWFGLEFKSTGWKDDCCVLKDFIVQTDYIPANTSLLVFSVQYYAKCGLSIMSLVFCLVEMFLK